ncbi:MAG: acetyl-CoA C-acyltransferase [Crocinitomicaceae bacterium]|jgi:acetyl-CoA C-acetyltransferase|nr:acetyl-CoA C-acyltransferase [Crocinitomicaceae bacterium]|tara:strand:- start:733 stop:1911 length:1179 start_codon:yes stop_codon:yes gene_type:complete
MKEIVIVAAKRTPMGSFGGSLSSVPATKLGAIAIKGALDSIDLNSNLVDEVFMGNVLQANLGQAPCRQAAIFAGINENTPCTTINKVCASGMKAIFLAAQSIKCGDSEIVIAGGMENMSMVPHYYNARKAKKLGDVKLTDGMVKDGLTDVYNKVHMGSCADECAKEYNISRDEQDNFAIQSYKKASDAIKSGLFKNEIVEVNIPQRKGDDIIIKEDEEYKNVKLEKLPKLKPVFSPNGTVTAANASTLNDGASAVVLMSIEKANELNLKPLAKIISYADASQEPKWFTTSPTKAIQKALEKSNLNTEDIDYWELNEAFSVVGIVNTKLLKIDPNKVDVNGGAVALGHPLGSSGSRIVITLINVLKQNKAKIGVAGICNGGGGASALIIENIN